MGLYKRSLLFFFVCVLAINILGCKSPMKQVSEEKEKLVIWAWDESFNIKAANEAKKIFIESNPDVEIEVVEMAQDDVISKLNTGLSSGDDTGLPDIVLIEDYLIHGYLTEYRESFADLSDIASIEDFAAYKTFVSQVDGSLYGIPFDSGVAALFYRIDMIEAAGYTTKDMENLTWSKYIEIGKAVREKTGNYMLTLSPNDLAHIRMMLQSAGTWYTNEEGNVNIEENQALKDAITVYQKIFDSGIAKQNADWNQYVMALNEGEVASVPIGCWAAISIMQAEEQRGKWEVAAFPRMEENADSVNASSIGGGGWYVLKCAGNEKLAKKFLKETFASNIELANTLAAEIGLVSTLKAAETAENYTNNIEFFNGQAIGRDLAAWQNLVPMVNYGDDTYEIEGVLIEAIQLILEGEDMDEVLKEYQLKIEETIE